MRDERVLRNEISRVYDRYSGNLDIECTERIKHEGYIEGIRFALGARERHNEPIPPEPAINSIVREIRSRYPSATMSLERVGNPGCEVEPEKVKLNIKFDSAKVISNFDGKPNSQVVAEMQEVQDEISDIVRSVDEEAPYMLYTGYNWDR